jgi:hypothetical protein
MGRAILIAAMGAVLWAAVIAALWSGVANVIAARHDSVLPQVVSKEDAEVATQAALRWKAVLKRNRQRPARLALAQPPALPSPAPQKIEAPPVPPPPVAPDTFVNPVLRYSECARVRVIPNGEIIWGPCFTKGRPL